MLAIQATPTHSFAFHLVVGAVDAVGCKERRCHVYAVYPCGGQRITAERSWLNWRWTAGITAVLKVSNMVEEHWHTQALERLESQHAFIG